VIKLWAGVELYRVGVETSRVGVGVGVETLDWGRSWSWSRS